MINRSSTMAHGHSDESRSRPCRVAIEIGLVIATLAVTGCSPSRGGANATPGSYEGGAEARRDPARSEELAQRAAEAIDRDPAAAEKLLREALTLDLYNGAAHNNLGTLMLAKGQLYEAANEFEWARKLLPGHPDPRINLAITLERAGRTDDALAAYGSALEVYPNHLPATKGLVRLQLRSGRTDERTLPMLREVALRGGTDQWRTWATARLSRWSEEKPATP
jgi:tetratricopeptide (TPR) repeat protein